jgi:hypothetical protein
MQGETQNFHVLMDAQYFFTETMRRSSMPWPRYRAAISATAWAGAIFAKTRSALLV